MTEKINTKYVLETLKEAKVEVLNLGVKIEGILKSNGFKTVSDLFIEVYDDKFLPHELSKIKFERDNFIQKVKNSSETCKYNLPVESLGLDARTVNGLKRARINTLGELKEKEKNGKIKNIRNIGEKSYQNIIKVLENY